MGISKIKISLQQIYDYFRSIPPDSEPDTHSFEHDGILLKENHLVRYKEHIEGLYLEEEIPDFEKIYEFEYTDYTYLTDNVQATGNIDITAYTKTSPYPSWIVGYNGEWTPPIPYPDGDGSGMGTLYNWNETKKSWEDILV